MSGKAADVAATGAKSNSIDKDRTRTPVISVRINNGGTLLAADHFLVEPSAEIFAISRDCLIRH